ncbi:ABC transporter permease subunit [Candidatus Poribacteria bacterium]
MIWTVMRKEIVHHIATTRVFVFFAVSTTLFVINAINFVGDYKSKLATYNEQQPDGSASRSTIGTSAIAKPNSLEFLVEGNSHMRPRYIRINLDGTLMSGVRSPYENFKLPNVRRIDWSFIIQTIYALFCVVLVFDAISGERERDTLRLMMSNSISRAQILLGKYLAALVVILVVFLIGGLLSLAVISLISVRALDVGGVAPFILYTILSVFYVSLFINMSLLLSTLTRTSVTALISLLFMVIVLVFVVPNLAGVVAGKLVNAPSDYETRKQHNAVGTEYVNEARNLRERIHNGELKDRDEIDEADRSIRYRMREARSQIRREYEVGLARKQKMAETVSLISPAAILHLSGESLANTGGAFQRRFRAAAERYQEIYLDYVRSKVGEIIPRWQPPRNFRLPDGSMINFPEVKPKSYDGDMSDFPVFQHPDPPIQQRLSDSSLGIALLLVWNVLFFMAAHLVFVRSDVK